MWNATSERLPAQAETEVDVKHVSVRSEHEILKVSVADTEHIGHYTHTYFMMQKCMH